MTSFFKSSSPQSQVLERPKLIFSNSFRAIQGHVSLKQIAWLLVALFLQLFLILLFVTYSRQQVLSLRPEQQQHEHVKSTGSLVEQCSSGLVYVYELPPVFNKDFLDNCDDLDPWIPWCTALSHEGFGPKAKDLWDIVPQDLAPTWYWTNMYAGEVIFHARILHYKCKTSNPELATAFYIPFYAALAIGKFLHSNHTAKERDWHCLKLNAWLQEQPFWKRSNGSDHFIVLGRTTWEFRRSKDEEWGSSFYHMPAMKKILRLSLERSLWDNLETSVPYPTGFHPRSNSDIERWQMFVRDRNRKSLFTFVGAKRKMKNDFRTSLMDYCHTEAGSCRAVDCSKLPCNDGTSAIHEAFLDSNFCLQPRGDSMTRRSMFDCMLAGSIPVLFWEASIRGQYEWFLPDEQESFSVFIDRNDVRMVHP